MTRSQKLELTWVGKDDRPRLEPRILIEDPALSYHAAARVTANDRFDNLLIQGDNLLALKALEQEYAGKVKCVFIDPPYNTGSAFEHYDDGVEHSLWLSMMRDRIDVLYRLLAGDGILFVTIDANELFYLGALLDEHFGRRNRVEVATWKKSYGGGAKSRFFVNQHEYALCYAKDIARLSPFLLPPDPKVLKYYKYQDEYFHVRGPYRLQPLATNSMDRRPNLRYRIVSDDGEDIWPEKQWQWNAERVTAARARGEIVIVKKSGKWSVNYKQYLKDQAGEERGAKPVSVIDGHYTQHGTNESVALFGQDNKFSFPKPEGLVAYLIGCCTSPGDLVLDSFLGSGTTAAVAHKMGRRWIGIELGDHAVTHCVPRLRKVIDGADLGGVTAQSNWKGGGGFRFLRLAPSLLERDHWGNWVVSREYNATMLAEAVCKLHGFRYEPNPQVFWQHGRSTERDYLYVTTQTLDARQLEWLNESVGPDRSLLVLCRAWLGSAEAWPNLSLKKLPNAVLGRCEFGRDDYSLRIAALPDAPVSAADDTESTKAQPEESGAPGQAQSRKAKAKATKRGAQSDPQTDLLAEGDA